MKTILSRLLPAFALALVASAAVAEPTVLRMNNYEPPAGVTNQNFYQPWVDRVNAADPDALRIEYFPGGGLGRDPTTQLEVVENGVADLAYILAPYHAGRFPDNLVLNFPFLGENTTEASIAASRLYQSGKMRGYDTVVPIGIMGSPVTLFNSVKPINSIDDIKGMRVRAADGIWAKLVQALGGVPVTNIPVNQSAENMSRGVIDASLDNWVSIDLFKNYEVAKNAYVVPFGQVITIMGINKETYEGLPENAKAALDSVSYDEYAKMWGGVIDGLSSTAEQRLRDDPDYTVVDFSAEDRAKIEAALEGIRQEWFAEDPQNEDVYNSFKAELEKVRSE